MICPSGQSADMHDRFVMRLQQCRLVRGVQQDPRPGGAVNPAEYRSPYRIDASISDISEILQHIGAHLPAPTRNGYLRELLLACSPGSISVRTRRARRVLRPLFAK